MLASSVAGARRKRKFCLRVAAAPGSARVSRVWFRRLAETVFPDNRNYTIIEYITKSPQLRDAIANTRTRALLGENESARKTVARRVN